MAELRQVWDLDVFFPGGSGSDEFSAYLSGLREELSELEQVISENEGAKEGDAWGQLVGRIQAFNNRLRQASAFLSCLTAQNVKDNKAQLLAASLSQMRADFGSLMNRIEQQMLTLSEADWQGLKEAPALNPVWFYLNEMRERAKDKLPADQEMLANSLAVDGYHAWGEFYNSTIVGRMSIQIEQDGQIREMSVGQVANLLISSDRRIREMAFQKYEKAWEQAAELCAGALNHLAGFRLNLYKRRGWNSVLREPLMINRMSQATLDAMWDAVEQGKSKLVPYLERKAQLLELPKLEWFDVGAPLGENEKTFSYTEAADFVVDHFGQFSSDMADLAKRAFSERWIESEDRPGKRPGAFCTTFPESKQSRVFMTFSGSADNVSTLAHELGHAYHGSVLKDMPAFTQRYAMNVAETASTFAEMIVADASIKAAQNDEEKVVLLDNKIQQSVAMFMNIHARFLFETRFYDQRKNGLLSVEELNQLMEEAQREAYRDALASYHPHFWASKLHFYSTGVPFYNFPYTFGHLLSTGVYMRALEEGPSFAEKYRALLQDTGRMTVEDLARKHLDVDLTQPDFWVQAVQHNLDDVDTFLALTN